MIDYSSLISFIWNSMGLAWMFGTTTFQRSFMLDKQYKVLVISESYRGRFLYMIPSVCLFRYYCRLLSIIICVRRHECSVEVGHQPRHKFLPWTVLLVGWLKCNYCLHRHLHDLNSIREIVKRNILIIFHNTITIFVLV